MIRTYRPTLLDRVHVVVNRVYGEVVVTYTLTFVNRAIEQYVDGRDDLHMYVGSRSYGEHE